MFQSIVFISVGAALGAVSRWFLALGLNAVWATMPLGTLAANLVGGYLVGLASSFFAAHADLPIELRLLVITGFLGGLTTFSTFSAEVVGILQTGAYVRAFLTIGVHLLGSLALTILGIASYGWFK
jgi:CrcB protein